MDAFNWLGYDSSEDTWIDDSDLDHARELLDDFEDNLPLQDRFPSFNGGGCVSGFPLPGNVSLWESLSGHIKRSPDLRHIGGTNHEAVGARCGTGIFHGTLRNGPSALGHNMASYLGHLM